jgi:hypothetical protein
MRLRLRQSSRNELPHYFFSTCPHPAILQVSKEARSEAERYYNLGFGAHAEFKDTEIISPPRIYVNPSVDRICIMDTITQRFRTAFEDLIHEVIYTHPKHVAFNAYAIEQDTYFDEVMDELYLFVDDFIIFHAKGQSPKPHVQATLVFNYLDHKSPHVLPAELEGVYDSVLQAIFPSENWEEDSDALKNSYKVSLGELKWKALVDLTGET